MAIVKLKKAEHESLVVLVKEMIQSGLSDTEIAEALRLKRKADLKNPSVETLPIIEVEEKPVKTQKSVKSTKQNRPTILAIRGQWKKTGENTYVPINKPKATSKKATSKKSASKAEPLPTSRKIDFGRSKVMKAIWAEMLPLFSKPFKYTTKNGKAKVYRYIPSDKIQQEFWNTYKQRHLNDHVGRRVAYKTRWASNHVYFLNINGKRGLYWSLV